MTIDWGRTAPVVVSIGIILLVAFLRNYSKTLAAILATMPINIPLALWVASSGSDMTQEAMATLTSNMFWNMFPTVLFIGVVVICVRAGWTLLPSILTGYVAWGIALLLLTWLRDWLAAA